MVSNDTIQREVKKVHTVWKLLGGHRDHRRHSTEHSVPSRARLHIGRESVTNTSDTCSLGTADVYNRHSTIMSGMSCEPATTKHDNSSYLTIPLKYQRGKEKSLVWTSQFFWHFSTVLQLNLNNIGDKSNRMNRICAQNYSVHTKWAHFDSPWQTSV